MFNVSISDRLKAAVNQLEATGTSLQARASASYNAAGQPIVGAAPASGAVVAGAAGPGQGQSAGAGQSVPQIKTDDAVPSTSTDTTASPGSVTSPRASDLSTSPRATYTASASHLADSALSGLRKSFNFNRGSLEGGRPSAAQLAGAANGPSAGTAAGTGSSGDGAKELKDMSTSTPSTSDTQKPPSRTGSPARFLSTAPSFGIGSDPSTAVPTPRQPRSPTPGTTGLGLSKLRSPARISITLDPSAEIPPPDPSDPATYPLPPSPSPNSAPLSIPISESTSISYADPLGASPLLPPTDPTSPGPVLGVEMQNEGQAELDKEVEAAEATLGAIDALESGPEQQTLNASGPQAPESERLEKADRMIRSMTQLPGGIQDLDALEGWMKSMKDKVSSSNSELIRLRGQMAHSRIEELRDTHRLEGTSQSSLITKLRAQLSTAESNLAARVADLSSLSDLKSDLARAQSQIKEEEEKRSKAIQLLKTVRLKLVKAEKDREEVEKDRAEERAERAKAAEEVEKIRAEKEREVQRLRAGFERELNGQKERGERDMKEKRSAWELEMITTKASHARELSNKTTIISGLEDIVKEITKTKDEQFHTIQAKQAEAETARAEAEAIQNRTKELEFQLREANERIGMLEETASADRNRDHGGANGISLGNRNRFTASPSPSPGPSRRNSQSGSGQIVASSSGISANSASHPLPTPAEVQRLVAEAESRAETKLTELRNRVRALEKERNDVEEEWGVKMQERIRELEGLKRRIQEKESEYQDSLSKIRDTEDLVKQGQTERKELEKEIQGLKDKMEEMAEDAAVAQDNEKSAKDEVAQIKLQIQAATLSLDEQKTLVTNLRAANKTLREELRKVQSSVQLMEKQRNPGVGYWSSTSQQQHQGQVNGGHGIGMGSRTTSTSGQITPSTETRRSTDTARTDQTGGKGSAVGGEGSGESKTNGNEEEEVNLEYLRNVILQFLEHPHMRRQLVSVLSVILHFTPQELRRLNSKLTA